MPLSLPALRPQPGITKTITRVGKFARTIRNDPGELELSPLCVRPTPIYIRDQHVSHVLFCVPMSNETYDVRKFKDLNVQKLNHYSMGLLAKSKRINPYAVSVFVVTKQATIHNHICRTHLSFKHSVYSYVFVYVPIIYHFFLYFSVAHMLCYEPIRFGIISQHHEACFRRNDDSFHPTILPEPFQLATGRQPGTFSENSNGKSYTNIWILKGGYRGSPPSPALVPPR